MAIEIVTKSQEASARHEAERKEQGAKGKLERQVIQDKAQNCVDMRNKKQEMRNKRRHSERLDPKKIKIRKIDWAV
jgi:hypothetical protein